VSENNKIIENLEGQIAILLGIDLAHLVFSFKQVEGVFQLDLITFNPRHNQSFLFHTCKAIDKVEALQKMFDYIKSNYRKEETFTIQWMRIGEDSLHTSYFRAKNIYDVLDKFYFDRDLNSYRIYSISLNPIS
jgi:hypothetical protein